MSALAKKIRERVRRRGYDFMRRHVVAVSPLEEIRERAIKAGKDADPESAGKILDELMKSGLWRREEAVPLISSGYVLGVQIRRAEKKYLQTHDDTSSP